jgi:ribosomal-protein-alanine N-acetyltransferase
MSHLQASIQLASSEAAAQIARMSRDLIEDGLPWSWTPQRVAASIRNPRANVVVARLDGRIAGFGIMRYGDDDAHLDLLAVAPDYRGAGLGRQLVQWLEKPALLGGIGAVFLEVRECRGGAQLFYDRIGYRKIKRISGYYQGREAAVRMGRELSLVPSGRGE